jgi:hypothetical protein
MTISGISLYNYIGQNGSKNGIKWPYVGQKLLKLPKNWSYDVFIMVLSISKILKIFSYFGPIFGQKTVFLPIWLKFFKAKSYYKMSIAGHTVKSNGPFFCLVIFDTFRTNIRMLFFIFCFFAILWDPKVAKSAFFVK